MIIRRETRPSYYHKPIVQGVNYSPLMVEIKEESWPEAIPAAVLPSNLPPTTGSSLCFVFFVFLRRLLLGIPRGSFI
jgi:hypothetical protein